MTVDMTGIDIVDIVDRGHAVSVYVECKGKEFAVNINSKTFNMLSEDEVLMKIKKACKGLSVDNKPKIDSIKAKYKK
ncbi:hypothetical protein KAT92_06100 [Candidatus Babeliales bacterium]|nr:hypothetical protein [Candidatus Babeliales bacterium]